MQRVEYARREGIILVDISDQIISELDGAFWEVDQEIQDGASVPTSLDRLTFSACRDRAWFTPTGLAHQPRDWSEFPGENGGVGVSGMAQLGAALSIPIRVGGVVGLGLAMQCQEIGIPLRGEFLSGSSERRVNVNPNFRDRPMDYGLYDGHVVELLTDPFDDDAGETLASLPGSVTSVPFGEQLVTIFLGGFMIAMGRILLHEGGRGLEHVDVDASLRTAWADTLGSLRKQGPT